MRATVFDPSASIARERDETRSFIDLLEREQRALRQADVSSLLTLAREKAQQAQQLIRLADTRNRWLETLGCTRDRNGMEEGLQRCGSADATDTWRELLQLAETASQLNKINGILIGQRLRYNQQALSVLQAATRSAGLYGADGQPTLFSGGRQLGEG
ncbi:flagella synthesis protein FlgN [Nitrosospira sp. NpAV]|uniref:flagella synthesis protein FlgN n=1 Tax=Nitrosospira sp. NpAV TaxID=58133 RepID=UPI0005A19039|nr:flagellar protein FlgN [Nitrosospira sp. NpAV]KIO49217.1 flagellar biosynthesis protein FlgN [Nitrosospira sp. NpAV]